MNLRAIIRFAPSHREHVLRIWESSVRATHHFLSPEDLGFFKDLVSDVDFTSFPVYVIAIGERAAGFIGIANGKVEMLFIDPAQMGKGHGKALLQFAINELGATSVDVNEQNIQAVGFYQSQGFRVVNRTQTDGSGKPYPILEMKL